MGAAGASLQCGESDDEDDGADCSDSFTPRWRGFRDDGGFPKTEKTLGDGRDVARGLAWGAGGMQGWRDSMEDAHLALPSIGAAVASPPPGGGAGGGDATRGAVGSWPRRQRGAEEGGRRRGDGDAAAAAAVARTWDDVSLFGVFDGHGGVQVARFCEKHLPQAIAKVSAAEPERALIEAFEGMDDLLRDPANLAEVRSLADEPRSYGQLHLAFARLVGHPNFIGCTAVVCCVWRDKLVVANAGDSRAVLCRGGRAVDLSSDHKPNDPEERARISAAGGWVESEPCGTIHRVNGDLSLSRAIGDLEYKQRKDLSAAEQVVTATPDVKTFERHADDEFIIIACDGVWDVVSSQQAVDQVRVALGGPPWARRARAGAPPSLSGIAAELMDRCLSPDLDETDGLGGDNMTVIVVDLLAGTAGVSAAAAAPLPMATGARLPCYAAGVAAAATPSPVTVAGRSGAGGGAGPLLTCRPAFVAQSSPRVALSPVAPTAQLR